ncbi:MAG: aldo/keto reductase [Candidatus Vogelbacteria bacterium CG10_big_fil_rev_8_21_14_0_10_45_14]|uniref:Aldo/keto reductase n=1 Tax=Candidatus Vogelbacteria bacterium CG10_big_fil_rev_8_21_14_0_10_45_14 TaxID=1975042 RepID=A0A2H0RKB1_9BACT|nr:MAG: aldo/keto reductase [Candidatus Vogelbacteria bacterium CG10_big_fil_rev_8_21_14_0_10_45_14]
MTIPTKKLRSGFEIPSLAVGTWKMGGLKWQEDPSYDDIGDVETIHRALALRVARFDTAEMYASGVAEHILGKAVSGYDRDKLFVTSKVAPENLSYEKLIHSCERSLENLGMEYLDLYLIHMPNHDIPYTDTMRALDNLLDRGVIMNIGICNALPETINKYQACSKNRFVLNQVHYNFLFRELEGCGMMEYAIENDLFIEAWRPLQYGSLAKRGITILDEMAEKYGCTQAQISLAWLLGQENVITLFKASKKEHLEENLKSVEIEMSKEDIGRLKHEFPIQFDKSNAVSLA